MKISHIIAVSICGIAWALYGILIQTTLCDSIPDKDAVFFVFPSLQKIILTLIMAQVFVYSLWAGISLMIRRSSNMEFRAALGKGVVSLYPGFCLFLLLGLFTPYISILYRLSKFLLDLGVIFPCIILALILLKNLKPKFNFERLFGFVAPISERKLGIILFIFVLAVYGLFTLRLVHPNAPEEERYYLLTGDEPHYLLVVHSLVFDRDFNMHNNLVEGHSKIYFDRAVDGLSRGGGTFRKYARGRGITATQEYWEGKRYSLCRLGLPLLLCPSYYLGYLWDHQIRLVVLLFFNLLTALLVWNVFSLTYYFVGNGTERRNLITKKTITLISALFFALSMPVLFYSSRIYTETAGVLLLVYAFRKIVMGKTDSWSSFSTGFCVAFLPWLHDKYIWFSLLLLVMFFFRCRHNLRALKLILFSAPILISILFLMRYYYLLFGVIYPVNMLPGFSWKSFLNAFPGHILDENHGLLPYSPFYFFVLPGAVFMWRQRRNDAIWLILFILSFYIGAASFKEWWGGLCPPGRYLVPILGLCIPFIGYAIYNLAKGRCLYHILGWLSIILGCFSMWFPGRLYRHLHPFIPYVDWINLRGLFPNMLPPNSNDYRLLLGWSFVIVMWAMWKVRTRLLLFCTIIIIVLLRKDSAVPQTDYHRLMLYRKLSRRENKVISVKTSKPAYSIIENRESAFGPSYITYEAERLLHNRKNRVEDTGSRVVVCGRIGKTQKGFLLWGPYKRFPAGRYEARLTMRAENIKDKSAPIAVFDVVSSKGTVVHAKKEIYETDLNLAHLRCERVGVGLVPTHGRPQGSPLRKKGNSYTIKVFDEYVEIVAGIKIKRDVTDIEFRIDYLENADIYIDRIDIIVK